MFIEINNTPSIHTVNSLPVQTHDYDDTLDLALEFLPCLLCMEVHMTSLSH